MPTEAGARVLSYHDVLLRKGDVDLLRGPHWLNDQVRLCCHSVACSKAYVPPVSRSLST